MGNYTDINAKAVDSWVEGGWEWGIPISPEAFQKVREGEWNLDLSPTKKVPHKWLAPYLKEGKLTGCKVLGLASGGGQQMPIFAALGAECTVLDYSEKQVENERIVSRREGYEIDIIRGDMTQPLPFEDASFDIIFHPISNCYVEDVQSIWHECFRVLKSGGLLLAGLDNGINYLFEDENPLVVVNKLPYNPLKDPVLYEKSVANNWGIQFSHTMEDQIGGQLRAGFMLTDLYEDGDGVGVGAYYPQFVITRALKP